MLSVSALVTAASAFASVMSPSRNACVIRTAMNRFRYDPYRCSVVPAALSIAAVPTIVEEAPVSPCVIASPKVTRVHRQRMSEIIMNVAADVKPVSASAPRFAYIKFKYQTLPFLAPFKISAGDWVFVEGDRGENLGQVVAITTERPEDEVTAKVVRRASQAERAALPSQRARELAAVKTAQTLVDAAGLTLKVVDTEFQTDLNKLTIVFSSKNTYFDFRKLQRALFREFRCRIWMYHQAELGTVVATQESKIQHIQTL